MKRFLGILIVLALVGGGVYVYLERDTLLGPKQVVVPVEVVGADGVGGIQFELLYDAQSLKAVDVKPGKRAKGCLFKHNLDDPGRVAVALATPQGIDGDGPIAEITFEPVGQLGGTMTLEAVQACDPSALPLSPSLGAAKVSPSGEVSAALIRFTE